MSNIPQEIQQEIIDEVISLHGNEYSNRINKGIQHIASLWRDSDGNEADFKAFCKTHFIADKDDLEIAFNKISRNLEQLYGHYNTLYLELQRPLHEPIGTINKLDELFGSMSPDAHLTDDLFANKLAFHIALNFPFYNLTEKNYLGKEWTRQEWAYARMGDVFTERIPAQVKQETGEVQSQSDIYVSEYNIYAGNIRNEEGQTYFDKDMILLSHWNLRDELKANYNKGMTGFEKQKILYKVMKRIIDQSIPKCIINDSSYQWNPTNNIVYENNIAIKTPSEKQERYQQILNNYRALRELDEFSPMQSYIERAFEADMQMTQLEIEQLFLQFLSSGVINKVGDHIKMRLGRNLQPFDIWYDGFKSRSSIDETKLNEITQDKYPDAQALKSDLSNILSGIGFSKDTAKFIASKIDVDAARGSGHAWGAQMKGANAHLRTRVNDHGMNYKGYNIAIHELGHNVEQTISLYFMDHYLLNGVPNTAFTEALAFVFQQRDLELLGIHDKNPQQEAYSVLDNFWSTYEIIGVSLLDQYTWKWMYDHPNATALDLKKAVNNMAIDIWNQYYSPVFGVKDEPILAVYSHMISNPLYLTNYAIGSLIEFQVEEHLKTHNFASEIIRMYRLGRLTPNIWMQQAVGKNISVNPMLEAADKAIKEL